MKKLIIIVLMFLLSLHLVTSALTDGLVYYSEDGGLISTVGNAGGTISGTVTNTSNSTECINPPCHRYNTDGSIALANDSALFDMMGQGTGANWTWNFWYYVDSANGADAVFHEPGDPNYPLYMIGSDNDHYFYVNGGGTVYRSNNDVIATTKTMITITRDLNNYIHVYQNTTLLPNAVIMNEARDITNLLFGQRDGVCFFDGTLDEIGFWERTLTSAEITQLYNNGGGLFYPFTGGSSDSLNISATSPDTNESFDVPTINFNTTVNSTESFDCSLYLNSSVNQSFKGFSSGTDTPVDFNVTFPSGENSYTWLIECNNSVDWENSTSKTLYIDSVTPTIVPNSYLGNNMTIVINDSFTGNLTYSDTNLYSINITINGTQHYNISNIGSPFLYNLSVNVENYTAGTYDLWTETCDGHTTAAIPDWEYHLSTNKITFDSLSITANGASKVTLKKELDRFSPTFAYTKTLTEKVYVLESDYPIERVIDTDYSGHFVILGSKQWVDFEDGTNSKVTCKQITNKKWEITVKNPSKTIEYNSIGALNCVNQTYKWFRAVESFNQSSLTVLENEPSPFELNVSFDNAFMVNITANLVYNNTAYSITPSTTSSLYTFSASFAANNISVNAINQSFYWEYVININDTVSDSYNTSSLSQEVFRIRLDNCNTWSTQSLKFLLLNESSNASMSGDTLFFITYYKYGRLYNFSGENTGNSTPQLCISPSWANFSGNMHIEYTNSSVGNFFYFTNNTNFDNVSNEIYLYLVESTSNVTFTVTDQDDNDVINVFIKVMKFDVGEGAYKTVEILKTDDSGQAIGHIVLNSVWYKFILEYGGVTVLETSPTLITSTSKTFRLDLLTDYFDNYDIVNGITYSQITWNNSTKNFAFTWSDPTARMHTMCMKVVRRGLNGDILINSSCVTTTAGTILLNVGESVGTNTYIATAYTHFDEHFILDVLSISFDKIWELFGDSGIFASFLIILLLVMVGIWNPIAALVLMALGFLVMNIIGLYHMDWEYLITLIILVGIAIWKQGRDK